MINKPLFVYFGHHKCATNYIRGVVHGVCQVLDFKDTNVPGLKTIGGDLKKYINENNINFLALTNANRRVAGELENVPAFHVIRDPRDIVVSAYFSHRYSHSTKKWDKLIGHREQLKQATLEEGLMLELEFSRQNLQAIGRWDYSLPNVLEIKMEDLTRDPERYFFEIFKHLDLLSESKKQDGKVTGKQLSKIIQKNRFEKKSRGRLPGEEDVTSHYRKGISGDWKNYFSREHIRFFKENYNDVLLKLGYESDPDWINDKGGRQNE